MRSIALFLLLLAPLPAFAGPAEDLHIKDAFDLARKKMWSAAIDEAKAGKSPILAKYFTWEYLKDPQGDAAFRDIADFLENNPDWPDRNTLLKRAEVALLAENPSDEMLSAWFVKHSPQTSLARRKGTRSKEELHAQIRDAWVRDDYTKDTESKILARYGPVLREENHVRRIDRLVWESKYADAKRLLKHVSYDHKRLFVARLALAEDSQKAPVEVVNVPPKLRSDPGLLYERIRWRARGGDREGVRELLLAAPDEIPYPEKWWPLRDRQIRLALSEGDVKLATQLLFGNGQKKGSVAYKESKWLEGWIALEFLNEAQKAYTVFSRLYGETETPAGRSRVAYWAARAAAATGRKADVVRWLSDAMHYPTTFYGQLAVWEANPRAALHIRSEEEPSSEEKHQFAKRELVRLVYALAAAHESERAERIILFLVDDAGSPGEAMLAARLGTQINRIDFSVRASKKVLSNDIVCLASGWPVIRFHATQDIETPLLLALSRQESEFFTGAVSSSGAIGLMQLLPSTAREIARKNDLAYSSGRLYDADYNMTIGSLYLRKMLDKFNGSYVLAIASYNAGPGRVGEWLSMYGMPEGSVHGMLDWIERIPFTETRNYVQHVLANLQVYRYLLAGSDMSRLMIDEDLIR